MSNIPRPSTPVGQIIEPEEDSPMSSTMSSPQFVNAEDLEDPFLGPGPLPGPPPPGLPPPPPPPPPPSDDSSEDEDYDYDYDDDDDDDEADSPGNNVVVGAGSRSPNGQFPPQRSEPVDGDGQPVTVPAPANDSASPPRDEPANPPVGHTVNDQNINDLSIDGQNLNDQNMNDQDVPDQSLADKNVNDQGRNSEGRSDQMTTNTAKESRASSSPPDLGPTQAQSPPRNSNFIVRYHQQLLPPPDMPIWKELLAYTHRWGAWATEINDKERREYIISHICDKVREAWNEGIKKEVIAAKVPQGHETMSEKELDAAMEEGRARQLERKNGNLRRHFSPSRAIVIDTRRNIFSDPPKRNTNYSISAGELAEAGVKWQNVKRRVEEGKLDPGTLFDRITAQLGSPSIIPGKHWLGKGQPSRYNTLKRDLLVYCIWEIFRSDSHLTHLGEVLLMLDDDHPDMDEARKALEAEQKLRNLIMAVALELDPQGEEDEVESISSGEDEDEPIFVRDSQRDVHEITDSESDAGKRIKRDAPEGSRPGAETPALLLVASMSFSQPDLLRKQFDFISNLIRPQANALLQEAGVADDLLLDESVDRWQMVYPRLQEAGINTAKINSLIYQINNRFAEIEAEQHHETIRNSTFRDIDGYPSRMEIWYTIPPEGFTNEELAAAFPSVPLSDTTFQNLVRSVATFQANRWFPAKGFDESESAAVATEPTQSRVAIIRINPALAYDPVAYGLGTVNSTQGFKWRYISTSTAAQRMRMDESVEHYVKWRIDMDRVKWPRPGPLRYGTYDLIALKGDPAGPRGEAIVHGVWDMHRKNDRKSVKLLEFENEHLSVKEREVWDLGFASLEPVPQGTMEEMEKVGMERKKELHAQAEAVKKAGEVATVQISTPIIKVPTSKGSGKRGGGRYGRGGGSAGSARTARSFAGSTPSKKGRKRKSLMVGFSEDESPRVKRRAATREVNYAEEGDDEGEDGEGYVPIESD